MEGEGGEMEGWEGRKEWGGVGEYASLSLGGKDAPGLESRQVWTARLTIG